MIRITKFGVSPTEGMKFKVDSAVRGDFMNTVPVHPTEEGFSVVDHVLHEMDQVTVTIILGVIGGDFNIDGGRESDAGGSSIENVVTSTGEVWAGNVTRSQINASYKFLKDLSDNGDIVNVNLNYYDFQMFSSMVIKSLSAVVGERILTCVVVFSEVRRATLETKQIDVVQDKDGNILYYPVDEALATESPLGAASLTPYYAMLSLIESVANSEVVAIPETAPGKSFSFNSMPFIVHKTYAVTFPDASVKTVSFMFKPGSLDTLPILNIYWQGSGCPMIMGSRRCNGFSGMVGNMTTIKVTHPSTGEHVFTAFIRDLKVTTSAGILKRKYLSADVWIEDLPE